MGDITVCDEVGLGVVLMSSLFHDENQSFLGDEMPREWIFDNSVPSGRSVFRQIRGVQRKPLPAFTVFQVTTDQNNQYAKVAYSATLHIPSPAPVDSTS